MYKTPMDVMDPENENENPGLTGQKVVIRMGDQQLNLTDDQETGPSVSQNRENAGWQASPGILEWSSTNEICGKF